MKRNWPFIIITGVGIFATFIFLYIFVYSLAVNTVKSAALLEKAYPHIKPQEYINFLKRKAKSNDLKIIQVRSEEKVFLIQMINEKKLEQIINIAPQVAPLVVINLVIYDLGNGTAVVANNPYLWDIVIDSPVIDEIAEDFSNELSDILDSIYWDYKKEKEMVK